MDLFSGSMLAVGLHRVSRELEERAIPLMGVLAAFVFAAQMINLPVSGGTSAHFLGGALVGVLLGPWAGLVVISVVLIVQCFLFQDGGVAALGSNIFNMGVLGSWASAYFYRSLYRIARGRRRIFWSGFVTAWTSILVSSLSCTAQLALSGVVSWTLGLSVIVGVHALLGLLEGIVTGTILESIASRRPDLFERRRV